MDAQKYLKIAIVGVICIVVLVVGYGIYINDASRRHIEKMTAAQYTVLPVARAAYRDIHAFVEDRNITVRALWTVDVTAQYEGVLDEIRVSPSQHVTEGDVLAVMRNTDLLGQTASAAADIEAARAQYLNAEQTVNRYHYLVEHNAISRQEYDSAVAQRDAARAQMESRVAKHDVMLSEQSKMTILAPRTASIIHVYHEAGKYVRAGEPIFMMADLRDLNAVTVLNHEDLMHLLDAGNSYLLEIQPHQLAYKAYPVAANPAPNPVKINQFRMTIVKMTPEAGVDSDYHEVTWRVENPGGILEPTYYDNVHILSMDKVRKLVVPNRSIQKDPETGEYYVYTLDEQSRLVRRKVKCGIEGKGLTEITEGLSEGEQVVAASPSGYSEGMKVGVEEYEF